MKRSFLSVRDMVLCSLSAALLTVCAWICVPVLQIAFTLQTFAVFFLLGVLGGKRGSIACLVYLLLGAVGLPVFSGFRGGMGILLGATGGYIWGFLAAALVYWLVTALFPGRLWVRLCGMVLGMAVCYACGTVWYFYHYTQGGLLAVISTCVIPYLLPDAVKIALAFYLSARFRRVLPNI